jgi:hypothetical protein
MRARTLREEPEEITRGSETFGQRKKEGQEEQKTQGIARRREEQRGTGEGRQKDKRAKELGA